MRTAIWTAVLKKGDFFMLSHELASRDKNQAKQEIEKKHLGFSVIAIVLGQHTIAHTFSERKVPEQVYYDIENNQPTGGSD